MKPKKKENQFYVTAVGHFNNVNGRKDKKNVWKTKPKMFLIPWN